MAILIDGYNLLHAAGIIPHGIGAGTLERARNALLNWLVETLPPDSLPETTVVFDAANPPPGRPREFNHRGLTVLYSTDYENADALLEALIRKSAVPKRLVVVSSDHRVQRAAKRRRSQAVDSDVWYFDTCHRTKHAPLEPESMKPETPLSATEVQDWLDEFSELIDDLHALDEVAPAPLATEPPSGRIEPVATEAAEPEKPVDDDADLANPFPPGYAEDLLGPNGDLEG